MVKGARSQLERYRGLGLSVSDRNLPLEAATDIEKMRETLEMVVAQSKTLSTDKTQTSNAMALLEEATSARSGLARDDFDVTRWKNETADARETLANSRSVVVNAVNETNAPIVKTEAATTNNSNTTAAATTPSQTKTVFQPVLNASTEKPKISQTVAANNKTETPAAADTKQPTQIAGAQNTESNSAPVRSRRIETAAAEDSSSQNNNTKTLTSIAANTETSKETTPIKVGSLIEYATKKTNPVYPVSAKTLRMTGVVKVELVIDETGQVAEVAKTSGPAMLQRAATDAVRKWKFKPFVRDGESVKAMGFVSFNFSL